MPQISNKVLSEVIKNFPQLEEIDISGGLYLNAVTIETIGRCCPLLKLLKYRHSYEISMRGDSCDDDGFAIAETMLGLHHLKINGNSLTNEGLVAILDRCPLLESLDLRGCLNLHWSGFSWKRCHGQIKDLRLPNNDVSLDDSFDGKVEYYSDGECETSDEEDLDNHYFGNLYYVK